MIKNINEEELENVTGGWQYANGSYVNYGNYVVYTVAPGDVLIKNPDLICIGQKLTIYPAVLR